MRAREERGAGVEGAGDLSLGLLFPVLPAGGTVLGCGQRDAAERPSFDTFCAHFPAGRGPRAGGGY